MLELETGVHYWGAVRPILLIRDARVVGRMPNSSAATLEQEVDLPYLQEEMPRAIEQSLDGVAGVSKIVPAMNRSGTRYNEATFSQSR